MSSAADEQLRQVDLCFVMDSTGSMSSYLAATRRELKAFATKLEAHSLHPKMAYGLVLFRDHPPEESTFVTEFYQLTTSADIQRPLDKAVATGGGDGPEAVVDGLADAVGKMAWRKGSHKVIMLAGDAPPHGEGASGDGFAGGCPCGRTVKQVSLNARDKGISIFCLGIGNDADMKRTFQEIAAIGGGAYVSLSDAGALIDQVLRITFAEFSKVDIDRLVLSVYRAGITAAAVASATGLSEDEALQSMDRLRRKEMIR